MDYFGPHMVIDLSDCNKDKLADKELVYNTLLELPEKIEQLRSKRHENRIDIGKVMLRKNIPADLLPLICSYAVAGTKIYNYM